MNETNEFTHWQCPKCNQINELGFDMCWNCQYEKTGKEKMLANDQISSELIQEEQVSTKKDLPKSPVFLNILGALAILGYFINIFSMHPTHNTHFIINVISSTLAIIGFIAIIWMKKWGLYLYSITCLWGYCYIGFVANAHEQPFLLIYQILPTIIIIWGFMNLKKMN